MKVITRDERPRPVVVTPAKGTLGDCTDETMKGECDIGRIIQRYGGNLAELARWRGSMSFGEQVNHNLEDNIEKYKSLETPTLTFESNEPSSIAANASSSEAKGLLGRLRTACSKDLYFSILSSRL